MADSSCLDHPVLTERYFYPWMGAVLVLGLWMTLDAFAG